MQAPVSKLQRRNPSSDSPPNQPDNPIALVARYITGPFATCFTNTPTTNTVPPSNLPRAPSVNNKSYSVASSTSQAGSDRSCSSSNASNRGWSRGSYFGSSHGSSQGSSHGSSRGGIFANSKVTVHGREPGSVKFTMEEICKATRNFSQSSRIGQGGFGIVYEGRLEDGTIVAIKRAKKGIYKKHLGVEFQSEIRTLAKAEHMNLVKFYGYLEHEGERIVVLEHVRNGTLREHLDGVHEIILDLAARLDIAIDVSHAITYLHMYTVLKVKRRKYPWLIMGTGKARPPLANPTFILSPHRLKLTTASMFEPFPPSQVAFLVNEPNDHPIIHRDIKSSNILLTEKFRAKVADFGFARLGADFDSGATHVSTQVKGTAGYLDPEYLKTSQLTEKSDVYSFGVLLVEVVSGRRPIEAKRELKERITTRWAMKKLSAGKGVSILDPKLEHSPSTDLAVEKILNLALQCLGPRGKNRPSMKSVGEMLWSIRKDYRNMLGSDVYSISSNSHLTFSVVEE